MDKSNPIQRWLENVELNARTSGRNPTNTLVAYKISIKQYLHFANSKIGLEEEVTPQDLIDEARRDVRYAQLKIRHFYVWLQGETATEDERQEITNYTLPEKGMRQTSAGSKSFGHIRSFYSYNDINFGRWRTPNMGNMVKATIENDRRHAIFTYDRESKQHIVDYSTLRDILDLLNLREKSIMLSLLSTGCDVGDLLKLNLGWLREQSDRERLMFRAARQKTTVPFWTFFSREATKSVRHYVETERKGADDKDPIWVSTRMPTKGSRLTGNVVAKCAMGAANKIGILPKGRIQNPFRPKRMRHIFITACKRAGISDDRTKTFSGHAGGIEMQYL